MNKYELDNIKKVINDLEYMQQRITEDIFIIKDILNKESIKRDKNIEKSTKYYNEVVKDNKETVPDKKESLKIHIPDDIAREIHGDEYVDKWNREHTVIQNEDNLYTTDLD